MFVSFIARKLSLMRAGRRSMIGAVVAIAGVALAVGTMILTVAVSRGFTHEVTERLHAFEAPLSIVAPAFVENGSVIEIPQELYEIINRTFPDVELAMVWKTPAMIKSESAFDGLILKNLSATSHRRFIGDSMTRGKLPDGVGEIALSSVTASRLGVDTCSRVDLAVFINDAVKLRRVGVVGVYDTHFVDYDENIAFVDSATMTSVFGVKDGDFASEIEIYPIEDVDDYRDMARKLQAEVSRASYNGTLDNYYAVENFNDIASPYLGWLALLDVNVWVIIGLMAFIAAFTLTASMIILVLERVNTIGILKALGAGNRVLQKIFMIVGLKLLVCGVVMADVLSVALIFLQRHFHIIPLDPENYYLSYVPVDFSLTTFIVINVCAVALGALTMLVPVRVITSVSPLRAITFE